MNAPILNLCGEINRRPNPNLRSMTIILSSLAIYKAMIRDAVPAARARLRIAIGDIKDM